MLRVRHIINIKYCLFLYDLHFVSNFVIKIACKITHLMRNLHPSHSAEEIKARDVK